MEERARLQGAFFQSGGGAHVYLVLMPCLR